MTTGTAPATLSLFERAGGAAGVARIVDRFYDLMEQEPLYRQLRAMHGADLSPMRQSLAGFLGGFLGGPRDWFDARPGACVMSLHRAMPITRETAAQWVHAMSRAMAECGLPVDLGSEMQQAFLRMANRMAANAQQAA